MTDMIVGIAGRKGHGKDTAAAGLLLEGFELVKFAGAMKRMLDAYLEYVGVDAPTRERMIEGDLKEVESELLCGRTPRYAMQTLGTEWGRDLMGKTLWTTAFELRRAQFSKVVCTDPRFPNEVDIIKGHGGFTVRVVRPGAPQTGADDHPSEKLIDTLEVDYEVLNIGTPAHLQQTLSALTRAEDETKRYGGPDRPVNAPLPINVYSGDGE